MTDGMKKKMSEEVFISHSTKDVEIATEIKQHLESKGASVFLASSSLKAGAEWSSEILAKLRESKFVLFLASKESCESKYVNQEIGGTVLLQKPLVPVLCGVSPDDLPGWSKEFQAVELTEDRTAVRGHLDRMAGTLRSGRFWGWVIFIGLILLIWHLAKKR